MRKNYSCKEVNQVVLDFVSVKAFSSKRGHVDIYPEFIVNRSKDLMIRGRAFYAIWDEEQGLWSRSEYDARRLIDQEIYKFAETYKTEDRVSLKLLANFSSRKWIEFQNYCKGCPDNFHDLDDKITFSNDKPKKKDYVSRRVPYPLVDADCPAYTELIETLYDKGERRKIEWTIGSILSGDSKNIQKFVVFYGSPGSGKSTILKVMEKLFDGYWVPFDSKALGSNGSFALELFRSNPLIAIQHEGDLSRIEDNTKINSMVSHESMVINEKFKSQYSIKCKTFLVLATNSPVKITDAKSGIIRRLIDIHPSGRLLERDRYDYIMDQIDFELGAIANHCLEVYKKLGLKFYDHYISTQMIGETNEFYNFIEYNYEFFAFDHPDGITLRMAWLRYKEYCEFANVNYPYRMMVFKHELMNYFDEFYERRANQYNVYVGFKKDKFKYKPSDEKSAEQVKEPESWLIFNKRKSLFDNEFGNCPAQYANADEIPSNKWNKVKTKLSDLDTKKLHYVKVPENLIVIDFDIKDSEGKKDAEANLKEASKWPKTYAELSKSGAGIHLHYLYDGDTSKLSRIFSEDVEVKVFSGNSSLRRALTKCNDIPIATISSGLPLKGEKKVLNGDQVRSERGLRELIKRSLRKEIHGHTKPEIDFIYHVLEEAYNSGLKYDVTDLRPAVQTLAMSSTHQAQYCIKMINKMKFQSEEPSDNIENYKDDGPIIFFDVEVFPNLFVIVWKKQGEGVSPVKMINPTPSEVEELTKFKLVGFNNRKYDNHILYARMMGYTEEQLFNLSQRIINDSSRDALFNEAYNLSYTDIYDFLSADHKMSLKKWEIKLGIHHQELGLPWDQPVPEDMWEKVADYCINDVMATEAVWDANQADWETREMLSDVSDLTVNDTTNQCTTKIIVGNDKNPQSQYIHTDLSTIFPGYRFDPYGIPKDDYAPWAKIVSGKSIYRGEDPGEGGRVYSQPGIYYHVAVLDIASMHPHSLIRLNLFGDKYTMRFKELVDARIYIKHKEYDKAKTVLGGKLAKYLDDPSKAKQLATALKTAINSVYGLTSAKFPNKLRDPRNVDNIVAKYGALFMINLQQEVQNKGFTVAHIKTDSIKIPNATSEIIQFVMDYGKEYGYSFEHESTYDRMCLINESVYIAKYESKESCMDRYGYIPEKNEEHSEEWTATGAQFQIPYVYKTLFSKKKIEFEDLCETKSVSTALYLDMNENLGEDEHEYRFVGKVGQFCPIVPGAGGGVLLRQGDNDKYSAATGTKKPWKIAKGEEPTFRWLESEMVKQLKLEDAIDKRYYNALVDDAVETISKYGDFEQFVSDDGKEVPSWMNIPEDAEEEMPFDDLDKNVA